MMTKANVRQALMWVVIFTPGTLILHYVMDTDWRHAIWYAVIAPLLLNQYLKWHRRSRRVVVQPSAKRRP